ncbi:MAG: TetR/AcrR family transcriptional regulator [Stackebrandtia sp.]
MRPSNRTEILQAALRLAQRNGVGAVTLEAVASEAGLSKGGLIYHFPGKEKLLAAVVDHILEGWENSMLDALGVPFPEASTTQKLTAYVRAVSDETLASIGDLAMLVDAAHDDALSARYRRLLERWAPTAPGVLSGDQLLARFAAEGMWLSEAVGVASVDPRARAAFKDRLLRLAEDPTTDKERS